MSKYRKKPVVIDAIQWTGENNQKIFEFLSDLPKGKLMIDERGKTKQGNEFYFTHGTFHGTRCLVIETLEGNMEASLNDYIIKGIKGEFYPCKPDIFEASYEKVEDVPGISGTPFVIKLEQ